MNSGFEENANGHSVPAPGFQDPSEESFGSSQRWELCLFVAGGSPKSLQAYANLRKICEAHLAGRYDIELIDLLKEPHLAKEYQIVAVPTLIRRSPAPVRRVIGDLSNYERAIAGIDLA